MTTKGKKFKALCEKVEKLTDVSVYFPETENAGEDIQYEDDGSLHVVRGGVRACFGIGQDRPAKQQNDRIRLVMKELGMEKLVTDDMLSDETEDSEDRRCPECGQRI